MNLQHVPDRRILGSDGIRYSACAYAQQRDDGLWVGWMEFSDGNGHVFRTSAATVQATCEAVVTWASELSLQEVRDALEEAQEEPQATNGRPVGQVRAEALNLGCC